MKSILSSRKGFTLVELLIVVAIIGVLSTIGIPTFRSMVQKAKKSEAKVALGGLYTAEAAFFAEFGGYGNQLAEIGFDLEGAGRIYGVGFSSVAGVCTLAAAIAPAAGSRPGTVITQVMGQYYTNPVNSLISQNGPIPAPLAGTLCGIGTVDANGTNFTASAAGIIAGGAALSIGTADIWEITEQRALSNCQDGVNRLADAPAHTCNVAR